MKSQFNFFLLFLFLGLLTHGQENKKASSPNASNVFMELFGNGAFVSINYDKRFSNSEKGFGGRVGVGFVPTNGVISHGSSSILTFPIALNYLSGNAPHYLEAGAGITIASEQVRYGNTYSAVRAAFIPSIGYRYQPAGKDFTGRLFISPLVSSNGIILTWGGISGGVKF